MFGADDKEYLEPMKHLRIAASALLASGLVAGSSILPASAGDRGSLDYVVLGDSYAAGVGAGSYTDPLCGISPLGYPGLLDERKQIDLTVNATCGGDTVAAVFGELGALDAGTELVTLTVGGNDVQYLNIISLCVQSPNTCEQTVNGALFLAQRDLAPALAALYRNIATAAPNAEVVVTGYPHLFSPEFGNAITLPIINPATGQPFTLSTAEQQTLNDGTDVLNEIIRTQATLAGFTYVDVVKRFDKHGLGSPQPWIQPFTDPSALHPNAKGYKNGYLHEIRNALN